jgi:hypothetical protein
VAAAHRFTGIAVALVVAHAGAESALAGILGVAVAWSFVASGLVAVAASVQPCTPVPPQNL